MLILVGLLLALALVLGSIPTGVLIARRRGVDLRQVGSGNIGATNVGRALGRRYALLVLLLDAAKGALPVLAARALIGSGVGAAAGPSALPWLPATTGLAAALGHSFSLFLGGKGGKAVATSFGAALVLAPLPAALSAAIYVVLFALFRISSVGSLAAALAFPAFVSWIGPRDAATIAFGVTVTALVFSRHKDNLRRLARGRELEG
jgi:glycerol-3-phosphate acyltransferase PlsY